MNNQYYSILNLALSGQDLPTKIDEIKSSWSGINEDILFELSQLDEVASHIAYILRKSDLNYSKKWDDEFVKVEKRIDTLMDELENIGQFLYRNNIKIVALKNAGITKGLYHNNACSPMGDLDLLVKSDDFLKAHKLLTGSLGYTFEFRSVLEEAELKTAFKDGGTEYYKVIKGYKIWIELQWRPIAGRWIQPHNEPNGDELIKKSKLITNSHIRILSPEDNLLQVSLHTAKHSYVRAPGFRLHSDVDRVVRFQSIDWEKFKNDVNNRRLKTSVYFSLFFAKKLLKTPIPQNILNNLKPSKVKKNIIKGFIDRANIYDQNKKKFSKIGYIIFNLLLYDSFFEVFRAVLPSYKTMKINYSIKYKISLPFFYLFRIKNLIFKRAQL